MDPLRGSILVRLPERLASRDQPLLLQESLQVASRRLVSIGMGNENEHGRVTGPYPSAEAEPA